MGTGPDLPHIRASRPSTVTLAALLQPAQTAQLARGPATHQPCPQRPEAGHLDALDGVRQPVWHFVELGWPWTESADQGGRRILPAEIRSAVWHSLIAGARGIIYFDHNFGPGTPGSTILENGYEDNRIEASAVNAQIKTLAPVLNGPFVTSGHSATDTMDGTVRYMLKWANGNFWLFAGADRGGGSASFSIPCIGNATAVVEGENRSLPVSNGTFTDSFADKNAIHIYRIDGGSSCGLT
jgi:hypothetical protein